MNLALASSEASHCQDLLSQAQYYVSRAHRIHEEEKSAREKQAEGLAAFNKFKEEERVRQQEEEVRRKEKELAARQEYLEKTKNALLNLETAAEPKKKSGGRGRGRGDDIVTDSDGSDGPRDGPREERPKKRAKKESSGKKRKQKRNEGNDSDSDGPPREKRGRKKKGVCILCM